MEIRPVQIADIDQAAALLLDSWKNAFGPHIPEAIVNNMNFEACQRSWEKVISHQDLHHLGAFKGKKLLGTAFGGPSRVNPESYQEVWSMHVITDLHRQGVGSQLFKALVNELKQSNPIQRIHLFCIAENKKALSFYEKLGGIIQPEIHSRRGFNELEVRWDS